MSMETVGAMAVAVLAAIALAAAAGIRAFIPLLAVGVGSRLGLIALNDKFGFLESDVAIAALTLAAIIELTADKIPFVDHALSALGAFVRPAAGFVAGLAVMGELPGPLAVGLALFFAVLTLGTHLGSAQTRVASTATTAGAGNPVLSFIEDGVATVISVLAVLAPLLAALLVFGLFYFIWKLARRIRRGRAPSRREDEPAL